jgi:hypothetical protein
MYAWIMKTSTTEKTSTESTIRETETDPVVSGTQLTTYEDAEAREVVDVEDNASFLWRASDPLPHQGMAEVLGRSYKVTEFVWAENDTAGQAITSLKFPQVLFDIPQIANKLEWFALFRCKGVKISVRINSTMFHYGAIGMSHVSGVGDPTIVDPVLGVDHQIHTRTFRQRMNNHVVILKAMTGETIEQKIPWEIPLQWLDVRKNVQYGRQAIIGEVWFDVMTPLFAVASSIQPVNVSVFANFIDPEVTAPLASTDPWPPPPFMVNTQSTEEKEKTDIMTQVTDGVSSVVSSFQSAVSMAAPIVEAAALLLDKPGTLQAPTLVENRSGFGTYYGYGSNQYPRMSLHPDAKTDVDSSMSTVGLKPSIRQLISVPGYWGEFSFQSTTNVGKELAAYRVSPCEWFYEDGMYNPTYLSYVASLFRYWRGSIDYHFHFITSKFVTARVRIAFKPYEVEDLGGDPKYPADGPGGDIISKVIDISGDTHVSLRIPYISDTLFKKCHDFDASPATRASLDYCTGGLTVTLVNEIASQTDNQHVFCFVWISGGPDMQFNHFAGQDRRWYIDVDPDTIPTEVAETQSAVRAFPELVEPIVDSSGVEVVAIADSEHFDDYASLGKRFSILFPDASDSFDCLPVLYRAGETIQQVSLCHYLAGPFRWIRGGGRARYVTGTTSTTRSWELNGNSYQRYEETGSIATDSGLELPYYDRLPFVRSLSQPSYFTTLAIKGDLGPTAGGSWFRAYSDDVGFSGLYSPPALRTSEPAPPPPVSALLTKKASARRR